MLEYSYVIFYRAFEYEHKTHKGKRRHSYPDSSHMLVIAKSQLLCQGSFRTKVRSQLTALNCGITPIATAGAADLSKDTHIFEVHLIPEHPTPASMQVLKETKAKST